MKLIQTIALTLSLSTPMLASAIESLPFSASLTGDNLYVASAGEVVLTFLSKDANFYSDLFLDGASESILNNQTAAVGTQYSLGNFEAGQLLSFSILVNKLDTFYTGAASRNADNLIHAAYSSVIGNTINIGFEDLFNGGDLDYNDLVFSVTNVYAAPTQVSPVSEPETYAMFLAGLGLMGWAGKRRQQK